MVIALLSPCVSANQTCPFDSFRMVVAKEFQCWREYFKYLVIDIITIYCIYYRKASLAGDIAYTWTPHAIEL